MTNSPPPKGIGFGDAGDTMRAIASITRGSGARRGHWFRGYREIVCSPAFHALGVVEVRVLMVLLAFAGEEGLAWPSNKTLADIIPNKPQSRIRAAIKALDQAGFLAILARGGGAGKSRVLQISAIAKQTENRDAPRPRNDTDNRDAARPPFGTTNGDASRPCSSEKKGDVGATKGGRLGNEKGDAPRPPNYEGTTKNYEGARPGVRSKRPPAPRDDSDPDSPPKSLGRAALGQALEDALGFRPTGSLSADGAT